MKLSIFQTHMGSIALLSLLPYTYAQSTLLPFNQSTTCNEQCQQLVQLSIAFEHDSHAHTPLDEFYGIPDTFNPSMKPGTLLRVETHTNLTNYTAPSGLTMSRIMYTSQNLNGTLVPASAFVLWPYAPFQYTKQQATSKFPLVAWSHGTAGHFVNCAPSNYRSLQYQFMTSYSLALEGFAVVATDYAGLGVTTSLDGEQTHEWLAGPSGANDVAYAIEAVRAAFPDQLDKDGPFVAMGHSQGGNVAWSFAERQVNSPLPGYRGTISMSPPVRILELVDSALKVSASTPPKAWPLWVPVVLNLQQLIIASITAVYPSYNSSGMTPLAYDRWYNVLKPLQGCLPTGDLAFADVPLNQIAKPGWNNNSIPQQWAERVAVGGKQFAGPLLVIAGENDVIPIDFLQQSVAASCRATAGNQSLEMFTYQAMEHFPVIQASRTKWMSWIKEKVGGGDGNWVRKGKGEEVCGNKTLVEGFNTNYTVQSVTPNWLVDWAGTPQEMWKLAL